MAVKFATRKNYELRTNKLDTHIHFTTPKMYKMSWFLVYYLFILFILCINSYIIKKQSLLSLNPYRSSTSLKSVVDNEKSNWLAVPYTDLTIGIPKEILPKEKRVSLTPESASLLRKHGFKVILEHDAGSSSSFSNSEYESVGCEIVTSANEVWSADIVIKIQPPTISEAQMLQNRTLISFIQPSINEDLMKQFEIQKSTIFAMDMIPRMLSRGQSYDALTSQANIAGYRAVIETATVFDRFFTGQITAAGKILPATVFIIGAGVAGLSAISTAKSLGAIVKAYDVRPVAKEQVESLGAQFLKVDYEEDGSGAGGYAKEMSDAYKKAEERCMKKWLKEADIVITTALLPGKPAPKLISNEMIEDMKAGSVILDMAASSKYGGNVEGSKPDIIVQTKNKIFIIGYTDLPSRSANTASRLYGNNAAKFLLSVGPTTDNNLKGFFYPDYSDPAVRSMLVIDKGELRYPNPNPYQSPSSVSTSMSSAEKSKKTTNEKSKEPTNEIKDIAIYTTIIAVIILLSGSASKDQNLTFLTTILLLSSYAGIKSVESVAPALHSPLMAVTNAISGMTAIGGLSLLGQDLLPDKPDQILGAIALLISVVNIFGGFQVASKMIGLFRQPNTGSGKNESLEWLLLPLLTTIGIIATNLDNKEVISLSGSGAGIGAIVGIGLLSDQKTASPGNILSMFAVLIGIVSSLAQLYTDGASVNVYSQFTLLSGIGAAIGLGIASKVGPTELPQTVAGFHSLVGIAAILTAIGEYVNHGMLMDFGATLAVALATFIGGVTATGSIVAYFKLDGKLGSRPLSLPGRDFINVGLLLTTTVLAGVMSVHANDVLSDIGLNSLIGLAIVSSILGAHLTASIGAADTPVVITLLNSYSGWALTAEGFLLGNPLLVSIGALIGFSGAFLTKIMCDNMNRSILNVVLGGVGTSDKSLSKKLTNNISTIEYREVDAVTAAQELRQSKVVTIVPGILISLNNLLQHHHQYQ